MDKIKAMMMDSLNLTWPNGINNPIQHRDIIRIYFMGMIDTMLRLNLNKEMLKCMDDWRFITKEDWTPDDSWKWWN